MPFITTSDGTEIYYTDQGDGRPIVLSHGWPLSSDAWQVELKLFADAGYRTIAHDRRGHGRSAKTYSGNDMQTYARDLAELVDSLDLRDVVLVGHSTGSGEVVKYAARHGKGRVAKVITAGCRPADHGQVPPTIPRVRRSRYSTGSAKGCSRTGRSFTRIFQDRSSVPIGKVRRCRRAPETNSGVRACWSTWPPPTTV